METLLTALGGSILGTLLTLGGLALLLRRAGERRKVEREARAKARMESPTVSLRPRDVDGHLLGDNGSPLWFPAMIDYLKARLESNGNAPIPIKQLLYEFIKWHGIEALREGDLSKGMPPLPQDPNTIH
jgi:hypothetical protein